MQQILLYFAYGSNLHPGRMASRCPAAKYLGPARLPNYRLVERHNADIDYAVGSTVHGALYAITPEDLARLDSFEGYPKAYRRLSLEVVFRQMACFAITYEMTGATKSERNGKPYPEEYRLICSEGARLRKIKNAFMESLHRGTPEKKGATDEVCESDRLRNTDARRTQQPFMPERHVHQPLRNPGNAL